MIPSNDYEFDDFRNEQEFDYIIVGAGPSAMGLMYALLQAYQKENATPDPPFSVCLIERGNVDGQPHDSTTKDPNEWYTAAHARNSLSATQIPTTIAGRVMDLPIGKGLGGTSNINACLCTPPLATDFDSWPDEWRKTILPSIHKVQSTLEGNGMIHQGCNKFEHVSFPFKEKGFLDMTSRVPTLVAKDPNNLNRWVRKNYYDGLVEPLLIKYPSLKESMTILLGAEVQRIVIDKDKTAKGVVYSTADGHLHSIGATKEVILSAGAIETPALLLTSGINLDGVGKHLKDQVLISRTYFTKWKQNDTISTNGIAAFGHLRNGNDIFQVAIVDPSGIPPILPLTVAMVLRRSFDGWALHRLWSGIFEVLFCITKRILSWTLYYSPLGYLLHHFTTTTLLFLMHPVSEGFISIRPKSNVQYKDLLLRSNVDLHINVGYLNDKRDVVTLKKGWDDCTREASCVEAFPTCIYRPLSLFFGFDWFAAYCQSFSQPYFHFCGSCMMKTQDRTDWVVDVDLTVRNHSHLRICDASVFPSTLSSPPALTCAALGYCLGQKILKEETAQPKR
jgi:choline dehydrogenase-like flavoprotein